MMFSDLLKLELGGKAFGDSVEEVGEGEGSSTVPATEDPEDVRQERAAGRRAHFCIEEDFIWWEVKLYKFSVLTLVLWRLGSKMTQQTAKDWSLNTELSALRGCQGGLSATTRPGVFQQQQVIIPLFLNAHLALSLKLSQSHEMCPTNRFICWRLYDLQGFTAGTVWAAITAESQSKQADDKVTCSGDDTFILLHSSQVWLNCVSMLAQLKPSCWG